MNRYQVILPPHGDIVAIKADRAFHDTKNQVLCFYDDTSGDTTQLVAQFCNWFGWNLLGPAEQKVTCEITP